MKRIVPALLAVLWSISAAAADLNPAVVYGRGAKFDKSFNEGVFTGAEDYRKATGTEFRDFEVRNDAQYEQALRTFARRGADPVLAVGFGQVAALGRVAAEFPATRFAIIDAVVDQPNVRSITFREHEGSFLVGMLAALASRTGTVGFVGGMDIPLIRRWACGYVQGIRHVRPEVKVLQNMAGTTPAAFTDPAKGAELARAQFDRGADVVFQAAGATGLGVLQAAADAGRLAIGSDANQNGLHPGRVLTSMVKRVDAATRMLFEDVAAGRWSPGIKSLGLAEGGVAWAQDDHNRALITPEMAAAVEQARADIVAGRLTVHDSMSDGRCPVQ